MKKLFIGIFILIFSLFLAGCTAPEETIYEIIEASAVEEEVFNEQHQPIADLVEAEKGLFDEILTLGIKEFAEVSNLSDKALENLNKREEHIEIEKEAITESREEFMKVAEEIEKIKDDELKQQAIELKELMEERFDTYDQLFAADTSGLAEDRKIYNMLKDENLKEEDFLTQIEVRNQSYEEVREVQETFNDLTIKFNDAKLQFYKDSGLNITTEA